MRLAETVINSETEEHNDGAVLTIAREVRQLLLGVEEGVLAYGIVLEVVDGKGRVMVQYLGFLKRYVVFLNKKVLNVYRVDNIASMKSHRPGWICTLWARYDRERFVRNNSPFLPLGRPLYPVCEGADTCMLLGLSAADAVETVAMPLLCRR